MIALLLTCFTLTADSPFRKASVTVHASKSVPASATVPPKDWSQTYGGSYDDYAYSVVQTSDGGYALAGYTDSSGAGGFDFYLVKTDLAGASSSSAGFNWSSIEGYVIIASVAIIVIAVALLILSTRGDRRDKSYNQKT